MDTPRAPSPLKVAAAFATLYIVWGSTYLAIGIAVKALPPLLMASARFFVSGAILTTYCVIRSPERLSLKQIGAAGLVGALLLSANGLVCWAELTVPTGMAALIVATMPLWMVVLEWLFFGGSQPRGSVMLGLGLGLGGVYLLISPSGISGPAPFAGIGALLLGCVFWAVGSLYSRRAPMPKSSLLATGLEMIAGGFVLGVGGLVRGEAAVFRWSNVTGTSLAAWAYLVTFGSLLGFTAYIWLLKVSTPTRVSTYAYVNPTIAVLLGWLLGKERLSTNMLAGGAIILASVGLILRQSRRPRKDAEPRPAQATHPSPSAPSAATGADIE